MAEGYLTTHVLDTSRGVPAEGIKVVLFRLVGTSYHKIAEAMTNADGRTNQPILPADSFTTGQYELVFDCDPYHRRHGAVSEDMSFLTSIPIRFGVSDENAHYHVPLLLSPFGYSTYRGS